MPSHKTASTKTSHDTTKSPKKLEMSTSRPLPSKEKDGLVPLRRNGSRCGPSASASATRPTAHCQASSTRRTLDPQVQIKPSIS
ncbi:rCG59918, partial [Rattus norvegicus]